MKGGRLLYKCRLCGEITDNCHVPDIFLAIPLLLIKGNLNCTPWAGTMGISTKKIHYCKNGKIGIADLIGGEEDKS